MRMDLREVARATGGTLLGENLEFADISTDSRQIAAGNLFVALRGERFDGHEFVADVLARGAVAAVVEASWAQAHPHLPLVGVADTRLALGAMASAWRRCFSGLLLAVTGSNGKTSVKEMTAAILRAHLGEQAVLATTGNLNNDIGVPLTLFRLRSHHQAAVLEMGMNHAGELDYLSRLAAPTVALVNNAQRAHMAEFPTVADVAKAKAEIFAGLGEDGTALYNADDLHADIFRAAAAKHRSLGFSLGGRADVRGAWVAGPWGGKLTITTSAGEMTVELQVPGEHNARNAVAATALAHCAGVPLPTIAAALGQYRGFKGRLQLRRGQQGTRLIDDTYNANPDSMRAAIDVLAAIPGRRILVMGDMGEVGSHVGQFHSEIGGYAKSMGIERLLALGEASAAAAHNFGSGAEHFRRPEDLLAALRPALDADTTVLVKGSRFMKMERVTDAIADEEK